MACGCNRSSGELGTATTTNQYGFDLGFIQDPRFLGAAGLAIGLISLAVILSRKRRRR